MNFNRNTTDEELETIIEQLTEYTTGVVAHNPLVLDEYPTDTELTDMDKHLLSQKIRKQ